MIEAMARYPAPITTLLLPILLLTACGGPTEDDAQGEVEMTISEDVAPRRAVLERSIEPLFDERTEGETRALVVMQGGEVVAEAYGPGFAADSRLLGWSLSKTVTAILAGMMVSDGRLALDRPVPVAAWSSPGDPRGVITLRHLLMMTSGLENRLTDKDGEGIEDYETDTNRMLFLDGARDMARFAESRPLQAAPGEEFDYNSSGTMVICDVMTNTLTTSKLPQRRRDAMLDFARGRLFEPLGIDSMVPEFDASGTMIGGTMIHATARDWARIGEFLRHNGSVRNAQIMPTSWPRAMKQPDPLNPAYGMHIWLNRPATDGHSPLFPGRASDKIFAAVGELGQFIIVDPERKLTLVRLGHTEAEGLEDLSQRLMEIISLF